MKKILYYFRPPNDWRVVKVYLGEWRNMDGVVCMYATYEILYSDFRRIYKLEISGTDPKQHNIYLKVVDALNEMIESNNALETVNQILNNK